MVVVMVVTGSLMVFMMVVPVMVVAVEAVVLYKVLQTLEVTVV
jgi:hypothetical protein